MREMNYLRMGSEEFEIADKKYRDGIFIDGDYNITRYPNAEGQNTFVYWRYISKDFEPMVAYSDDVEYAVKMANEQGATCAINASRWDISTNDFYGYFRANGDTIHENDKTSGSNSRHILCYKNGILSHSDITMSTQLLDSQDYEWALTGFEAIIINGEPTERATPDTTTSTDYHPRSFIAQTNNGDYIIGCCDGRSGRSFGFRLSDIYGFLTSLGYGIRFAYSLDGGGSVSLVEKGEKVNSYINNENRQVKSVIYFKKPNAHYSDVLKKGVTDIDNLYRSKVNTYEYKEGDVSSYSVNNTKNLQFFSLETLKPLAYLRFQKDRVFAGVQNEFSDSGSAYNLFDIAPNRFLYNEISRFLPKLNFGSDEFVDSFPSAHETGVWTIRMSSSQAAQNLGMTVSDYGHGIYLRLRGAANFDLIFTRAHVFYRYDNGAPISLN